MYIVYDQKAAYNLIGGGDHTLNHYGAYYLALWEAIKFATQVSQSFDFEGSMHSNIEPVLRLLGAEALYGNHKRKLLARISLFRAFRNA